MINKRIELTALFMKKGVLIAMFMLAIGCMIQAAVNIVWRALPKLRIFGIDRHKNTTELSQRKIKLRSAVIER